jgi:hypothetical protein
MISERASLKAGPFLCVQRVERGAFFPHIRAFEFEPVERRRVSPS